MKRLKKVTAETNNVATIIGELQDTSNELVDAIFELIDNLPAIKQSITDYDRENAKYGGAIANELPEKLNDIVKELNDVVQDVKGISDYFMF